MSNSNKPLDNYKPKLNLDDFVEPPPTSRKPAPGSKRFLSKQLDIPKDTVHDQLNLFVEQMFVNPVTGENIHVDRMNSLEISQTHASAHLSVYKDLYKIIAPFVRKDNEDTDTAIESIVDEEVSTDSEDITKTIESLFKKQHRISRVYEHKRRADAFVSREVQHYQFSTIANSLDRVNHFLNSSLNTYLKKSIELKYKHIFVAKDTLMTLKAMSGILESKLENIKHNTSLPDIQKAFITETFTNKVREKIMSAFMKPIPGLNPRFYKELGRNVRKNVYLSGKDNLYDYAFEDNDKDSPAIKLLKAGLRRSLPVTDRVDDLYSNTKNPIGFELQDKKENFLKRFPKINKLVQDIVPDLHNRARINNPLIAGGGVQSAFDKATRTSIIEIIPGWLGRIHKTLRDMHTGRDNEEEVYDIFNRRFTTVSDLKQTVAKYTNRNSFSRINERGFTGVGVLAGAYDLNKSFIAPKVDFNSLKKEIVRFYLNHALAAYRLNPEAIKAFSDSSPLTGNDDKYIKTVFKDVKDPIRLAGIITTSVYTRTGIDDDVVKKINQSIQSHTNDNFQERFDNLFETHGYRQYFSDELDKYGHVKDSYVVANKLFNLEDHEISRANLEKEHARFLEGRRRRGFDLNKPGEMGWKYGDKTIDRAKRRQKFTKLEKSSASFEEWSKNHKTYDDEIPTTTTRPSFMSTDIVNVKDVFAIEQRQTLINSFEQLRRDLSLVNQGSSTTTSDDTSSPTSILSTISQTLSGMKEDKAFVDFAIMDSLVKIQSLLSGQGNMNPSGDKQQFTAFVNAAGKIDPSSSAAAGRFRSLLMTSWRKISSSGVLGTSIRMGVGANLLGPLGAFLGYDSASGFQKTRALARGAGTVMKHTAGLSMGLLGMSMSAGFGAAKLGLGGLSKGLGFGAGLFKKKKSSEVKPLEEYFFDIYTQESFKINKPIATAKDQENKLVFFNDGTVIKNSFLIDKPLIDRYSNIVVSQENIDEGLLDNTGKPIRSQTTSPTGKNKTTGFKIPNFFKSKPKDGSEGTSGGSSIFTSKVIGAALGGLLGGPAGAIAGLVLGGKLKGMGGVGRFINSKTIGGALGGVVGGLPGMLLGAGAGTLAGKGLSMVKDKMFGKKEKGTGQTGTVELVKYQFKEIIKRLDKIVKNTRNVQADDDSEEFRSGSFLNRMKSKLKSSDKAKTHKTEGKVFGKGLLSGGLDGIKSLGGKGLGGLMGLMGMGGLEDVLSTTGDIVSSKPATGLMSRAGRGIIQGGKAALGLGGRGAMMAGRGLLAGAAAIPGLATSAMAATGSALTGLAGTTAGVLAAIPVAGWIALGVGAVALGGYGLYKYLKHSDGSKKLLQERIKVYGMAQVPDVDDVRKLENRIHEYLIKEDGPLTEKELKRYLKNFKLPDTEQSLGMFGDFISHRFIPMFGAYLKTIESFDKQYKDMKKIDEKDPIYEPFKQKMLQAMSSVKTSGPAFAEILNPGKEKDDTSKDPKGPITDSDTKKTKVATTIEKVEKKDQYRDPKKQEVQGKGKKIPTAEAFKPKDDLFKLIQTTQDSQLRVLRSIHHEVKLMRLIMEKENNDDFDLLGTLRNAAGSIGDTISTGADSLINWGKKKLNGNKLFTSPVRTAAAGVSKAVGVPEDYMLASALIESTGGYASDDPGNSHKGPWQNGPDAMKHMGVRGNIADPNVSALTAAKYYQYHKKELSKDKYRKLGIFPTDANIYLAHQQGLGGIEALYSGKHVDTENKSRNGGAGMSHEEFVKFTHDRYDHAINQVRNMRYKEAQEVEAQKPPVSLSGKMEVDPSQAIINVSKPQ